MAVIEAGNLRVIATGASVRSRLASSALGKCSLQLVNPTKRTSMKYTSLNFATVSQVPPQHGRSLSMITMGLYDCSCLLRSAASRLIKLS